MFVARRLCLQDRAIYQAVGSRIFIMEAGGRSQASPRNVFGLQSDTVTGFSPSNSVLLCQYHSTNNPYSSSSTRCSNQKSRKAQLETNKQSNALSNVERFVYESDFHIASSASDF